MKNIERGIITALVVVILIISALHYQPHKTGEIELSRSQKIELIRSYYAGNGAK